MKKIIKTILVSLMIAVFMVTIFLVARIIFVVISHPPYKVKVHTIKKFSTVYNVPTIINKEKFLNNLMLCPYWKVEKESTFNQGNETETFRARARSIEYMSGVNVDIIFSEYTNLKNCNIYRKEKPIVLDIFGFGEEKVGANSYSTLVFQLSDNGDIYLLVGEQGSDLNRKTTFARITDILNEVERINKLPESYSTKDVYKDFFNLIFGNIGIESSVVKRTPGLQDRDTFYGYFKAADGVNYDGINIKISHPVYCNGEGTRPSNRIRKAEYVGKPYVKNDLMYFQIEDNAVYLAKQEYNQKFGTFSGSGSFEGKLEIMNKEGKILYETTDKFKGWER